MNLEIISADYVDYDGVEGATEQSSVRLSYYLTYAIGPTTMDTATN